MTLPCGTPDFTSRHDDFLPMTTTLCRRPFMNSPIHSPYPYSMTAFFYISPSTLPCNNSLRTGLLYWHTVVLEYVVIQQQLHFLYYFHNPLWKGCHVIHLYY